MQHLIEDEPSGPDIALAGIWLRFEYLRGHVERCSHRSSYLHPIRHIFLSEAEVADLDHSLFQHQIGWLEVSA
jgi:hypothetical protein